MVLETIRHHIGAKNGIMGQNIPMTLVMRCRRGRKHGTAGTR
jgi:hypothetical protein